MPMNIVIHEKRKALGLTQEKIAEYLGVSTPAVNKWEKGVTFPDITLLPALARLLEVDLNTLLCFNEEMSEQEINNFVKQLNDCYHENGFESAFALGLDKVREYPNCYPLIHTIAIMLDASLMMSDINAADKKRYEDEIIALYARSAKSKDAQIRDKSGFMLASKYIGLKMYEKAQEILDTLPERSALDKQLLQSDLHIAKNDLDKAGYRLQHKLLLLANDIQSVLMKLADIECKSQNPQYAYAIADVSKAFVSLFDLWNYSSFVIELDVAVSQKDTAKTLELLKELFEAVYHPWKIQKDYLYHYVKLNEKQNTLALQMIPALLTELESKDKYDFLRSDEKFKAFVQNYRKKVF